MTNTNINGNPCWTDLSSANPDGARDFYGQLFGWTFTEPREDLGGYSRASKDGKNVAGLFPLMPGMTTSVWTLHFGTDDIAKCEQQVSDNGGTVMSPTMAVEEMGSMALAQDPTGAVFGLWQAGTFDGAEMFNEPGSLVWEDLRSHDAVASRAFFTSLFGYRHDALPMETPMDYKTFSHADSDRPLGGMGDMAGAPDGVPSHWVVYFAVDDTPTAVDLVKKLGGSVIAGMMQTPFGRQSTVVDPYGAAFCIIDNQRL